MTHTRRLNWGILGAGIIASTMAKALDLSPNNQLYAVASKSASKARLFADQHGIENAFSYQDLVDSKDIDVIYVATTHNYHFENARLALEHGKHVVMEKPFTVNASEARELVNIARGRMLFLMEAIWTRFLPGMQLLKTKIADHEIGQLRQFNLSFGGFVPPKYEKRLKDPNLAGGVTLDMGIYPISFVCYMLGELPVEIKSMARFSSSGVDELSNYLFRFPSGCLASICTSYDLKMRNEATIYGMEGYVTLPQFPGGSQFIIHRHGGTNEIIESVEFSDDRFDNGFIYQVEEAARCIRVGKLESNIIPLDETVGIMGIMDEMRKDWGFKYPFE